TGCPRKRSTRSLHSADRLRRSASVGMTGWDGLVCLQRLAISDYVAVMFLQRLREAVMAVAVCNKVKIFRAVRMHGGFEPAASGIADRSGRQSREAIGVVGRIHGQVGVVQRPFISAGELLGIDDTRIGVERHSFGQAVVVDAGHARALLSDSGFP